VASISRREVGGKPRYDVNYREPDGRRRRKTFARKVDADNFLAIVEADKLRGVYVDPDAGRITFRAFAETWMADQTFEATTREAMQQRLTKHIYPVLGSRRLVDIKPSTIQNWLASLSVRSSTYRRVLFANVSGVLSAAVDDELIGKNPCKAGSVRAPKAESKKVVPWSGERVAAVRHALSARDRIALDLAAGLGLRQGEVFGLSPSDVDFLRGSVEVRRQVKLLGGNRQVFGLPKGNKERTVPLPSEVRDLLAAYLADRPARRVTLPWRELDGEPVTVALVVSNREHRAMNRNYFNAFIWHKALAAAGVPGGRENGLHALRHFYASVLLDAGESIKAVSEYLGHADAGFTLRTYTHLMPSSDKRTRSAIDRVFATWTAQREGSTTTRPAL
jgi:integrase